MQRPRVRSLWKPPIFRPATEIHFLSERKRLASAHHGHERKLKPLALQSALVNRNSLRVATLLGCLLLLPLNRLPNR